jgi:hypothetical protein
MRFGRIAKRNGEYLLLIRQEIDGEEHLAVRSSHLEAHPEPVAFQLLRESEAIEALVTTAKWVIKDKGFTIPWEDVDSLLDALDELSVMTAIDRPVRIDLPGGRQLQAALKSYNGHPYVDIREFVPGKQVDWRKTRFGVTFPPDSIPEFRSVLAELCASV